MKTIYDIARTELRLLFYSPVAWLILIVFTLQTALSFMDSYESLVLYQSIGNPIVAVTSQIFSGYSGVFNVAQNYLYLYIPLLTMGLLSREYNSESIKLLYSSPIKNYEIILGKYLSMMIFGLILIGILLLYVLFGLLTIKDFDLTSTLSGLLGIYLLLCAYAAIGLFMSSITSYQIIAAIGTLATLALLNYAGGIWQDIEFVRDLTFWLSIQGRATEMIFGLICSEDVIYFILIAILFVALSIIKLQSKRQKQPRGIALKKYLITIISVFLIGYLSSRPTLMTFYDATATKVMTLTPNSQEIMNKLNERVKITTYVNIIDDNFFYGLPKHINYDLKLFKQYRRFKPDMEFKYIYYYDTVFDSRLNVHFPDLSLKEIMVKKAQTYDLDTNMFISPEEIAQIVNLQPEKNRFVRTIEKENGDKVFLRLYDDMQKFPSETEISAAFKRLVMDLPVIGFVHGHGERSITREGDRDYSMFAFNKPFRYSLINQGFEVKNINLKNPISQEINILVISDMHATPDEEELENLESYISRGGNLLIASEPQSQHFINPIIEKFGVRLIPGYLVKDSDDFSPDFMIGKPTKQSCEFSYIFDYMHKKEYVVTMPGVSGIEIFDTNNFKNIPLFYCHAVDSWINPEDITYDNYSNQKHLIENKKENPYTTILALEREYKTKQQKIIILGDSDCLSNKEVNTMRGDIPAANYSLITGVFFWLSDEEVPIDIRRPLPTDDRIKMDVNTASFWKIIFIGVLPLILILGYLLIWIKRRGR